ncbi:MAG: flagellar hook-associated protein FlgK [Betaproteobacteria bacterium]
MTSSIMSTAQTGLQTAQAGLLVTSQNVAGASVEGYSRRKANVVVDRMANNSGQIDGTSFAVDGFVRDYSYLLESQRLTQQGKTSFTDTLVQTTQMLDSIIADDNNSIATAVSQFFDAAGQMVGSPESVAHRSNLTGKAEMVVQRMVGLANTLDQVDKDARTALKTTLESVNTITGQLAQMNVKIAAGFSEGNFTPSADYLDQRDLLLLKLQKLVGGQSVVNADATATHYLEGIPLVEGAGANVFKTDNLQGTVDKIQVQYVTYQSQWPEARFPREFNLTTPTVATSFIQAGEAGAYIKVLRDFLPDVNRRLDAVAIGLLKTVNDISPDPIFGFKTSTGSIVSNTSVDPYLRAIPAVTTPGDIYAIRNQLDPANTNFSAALSELHARNMVSLAPRNADEWRIESDHVYAIEAARATFSDPIADIVASVGTTIATWSNDNKANQSILKVLNDKHESIAGVNLDEEAANMVKFQQLYAASSKLIQTGNQMFETLLSMVSR